MFDDYIGIIDVVCDVVKCLGLGLDVFVCCIYVIVLFVSFEDL